VMGAEISDGSPSAQLISDQLGCEVQVFASYRVSECHLWERAGHGGERRFFSIEDGEAELVGPESAIESQLGIDQFVAAWGQMDDDDGEEADMDFDLPNEDTVMAVAAGWSLDPNTLEGPDDRLGWYSATGINRSLLRS
jgi:hypothetical protein